MHINFLCVFADLHKSHCFSQLKLENVCNILIKDKKVTSIQGCDSPSLLYYFLALFKRKINFYRI
jgi:hypothetical protein